MKVKKLDTWIHSELESRLGEYWYLWKHTYDVIKLFYGATLHIFINENGKECLITRTMKTMDKGNINCLILDSIAPYWYVDLFLANKFFLKECGFNLIGDSRKDLLINFTNFTNFKEYKSKISSRLVRYYNICEKQLIFKEVSMKDFKKYYLLLADQKYLYWKEKEEYSPRYLDFGFTAGPIFANKCFLILKDNEPIAFSWFEGRGKEIIWYNTYYNLQYRQKYALGNYMLLKVIQLIFKKYSMFNMGIHVFDYKKQWITTERNVKGIERI
jgi:hypothetical protein